MFSAKLSAVVLQQKPAAHHGLDFGERQVAGGLGEAAVDEAGIAAQLDELPALHLRSGLQ